MQEKSNKGRELREWSLLQNKKDVNEWELTDYIK